MLKKWKVSKSIVAVACWWLCCEYSARFVVPSSDNFVDHTLVDKPFVVEFSNEVFEFYRVSCYVKQYFAVNSLMTSNKLVQLFSSQSLWSHSLGSNAEWPRWLCKKLLFITFTFVNVANVVEFQLSSSSRRFLFRKW